MFISFELRYKYNFENLQTNHCFKFMVCNLQFNYGFKPENIFLRNIFRVLKLTNV